MELKKNMEKARDYISYQMNLFRDTIRRSNVQINQENV